MYTVYKITNKINNKCYIGSTTHIEKRWQQHKNDAYNENSPHYNYPLQQAFRKYGLENFTFEILKQDFQSELEMQLYENQMIISFNSCDEGYNQTYHTIPSENAKENLKKYLKQVSQKCAKVDIDENIIEVYESYHEAALKNNNYNSNIDEASAIRDICKGNGITYKGQYFRDLDENGHVKSLPIKRPNGKKKIVGILLDNPQEKIYFNSISEAAKELSTYRQSISKCIQGDIRYSVVKGYIWRELDIHNNIIENDILIQDKINQYNESNPKINGERHSIKEWCQIYNISRNCYYYRRKKGITVLEALMTPKKE